MMKRALVKGSIGQDVGAVRPERLHTPADTGFVILNFSGLPADDGAPQASAPRRARTKTYGSDALAAAHELAEGLHSTGLYDGRTMREFDELCLTEVLPMAPHDIRSLRDATGVSQAVLARVLNVTPNAVRQWERGEKKPTGSALKLLSLVRSKGLRAIL
jgi:putative transcriptional regulator